MTANPYAAEIDAGAAWLDANVPNWLQVFVADRGAGLHMDDCNRCVLGHVLGSYWDERSPIYRFGARTPGALLCDTACCDEQDQVEEYIRNTALVQRAAVPLGFSIPDGVDPDEEHWAWGRLAAGWQELIEKRLAETGQMV